MIMGLGIDIIEIGRIANLIEKKGELLLKRLFTPDELAICGQAAHRLAGRFAAKEAFFKVPGFAGLNGGKLKFRMTLWAPLTFGFPVGCKPIWKQPASTAPI